MFNGNGIPERYWIPTEAGPNYELTSCLSPLARYRSDTHVITGLDNPAAAVGQRRHAFGLDAAKKSLELYPKGQRKNNFTFCSRQARTLFAFCNGASWRQLLSQCAA